jgi:hypothetical protein
MYVHNAKKYEKKEGLYSSPNCTFVKRKKNKYNERIFINIEKKLKKK